MDMEKAQREEGRWRILRTLDAGRPGKLSDTMLWRTLTDSELPLTLRDVKRELQFLEGLKLVKIDRRESLGEMLWFAELTSEGIQVVEYAIPCRAGIARAPRF